MPLLSTLLGCQAMAFCFLTWWWHRYDEVHDDPQEELPCQEEEDDKDAICWLLGEILLSYCLVVAVLKILYHGLEWMHENGYGGILSSGCRLKYSKGKRELSDGSKKGSRNEPRGSGCACCCLFRICRILRKLFGEKVKVSVDSPASSVSLKRRLSKRLSSLNKQTFCDSLSWVSGTLDSRLTSEGSLSVSSQKRKKTKWMDKAPGTHWVREPPCSHCKVKRTKEWLSQHFFEEDLPPHEKSG